MNDFESLLRDHGKILFVEAIDIESLPRRIDSYKKKLSKAFFCRVQTGKIEYELFVCEPINFPKTLPYFFLSFPETHDLHNHVNFNGDICFTDKNASIFIDTDNPGAVLYQSIDLTIKVLEGSYHRDLTDLLEEFEGYWQSLPKSTTIDCFFDPGDNLTEIKFKIDSSPSQKKVFAKRTTPVLCYSLNLPENYGYTKRFNNKQIKNGFYIPLHSPVFPPDMDTGLTPNYVKKLIKNIERSECDQFRKQLKKSDKAKNRKEKDRIEFFVFSQTRPSQQKAMFGVCVAGRSRYPFFLSDNTENWHVLPINIRRHNREYLVERGGGEKSINDLSIAIIGCGAVGSRIVEQLALSGIGKLVIIDDDILTADNIHRHLLGGEYIKNHKVKAIAQHLCQRLPYVEVVAEPITREKWLEKKGFEQIDIIIDATADLTGLREMNKQFYNSISSPPPVIYCWLEACGIGGHSILIDHNSNGCLECLIEKGLQGPYFRSSFLKPYQSVSKDLTGCGGGFTPFSALDAIKTATITSELVLNYIFNNKSACYKFWIGGDSEALKQNLKVNNWYYKAVSMTPELNPNDYFKPSCPVCRKNT